MGRRVSLPGWVVLVVAVMVGGVAAPAEGAPAAVFTVYLAPVSAGGSDGNTGLTTGEPVVSLIRVEQVLRAARPSTDVEVRIKQGLYELPPMQNWRFYVPGHTISFLPIDYEYGEGIDGIDGRPVFRNKRNADGTYPDGFWLIARPGANPGDPLYDGGTSGLRFYYLQVERYSHGGVGINAGTATDGSSDPPIHVRANDGLNGNTFFGMYFANIGNKWTGGAGHQYNSNIISRSADISVNGGPAQRVWFRNTWAWNNFWSLTVPVTLRPGPNTIQFANPSAFAPDLDRINIAPLLVNG